nr:MAG TPA: hypothetical protein [Caudoviricetes sp.]
MYKSCINKRTVEKSTVLIILAEDMGLEPTGLLRLT